LLLHLLLGNILLKWIGATFSKTSMIPKYCYLYTRHLELSKTDKSPLPPVKNKLSSTSQRNQVNMEGYIPCDDDPLSFRSFAIETRSQAPKTTPKGVEGTIIDPKDNEKVKLPTNGRLPSPPRNRVPWTPNKVNLPNNPPPCFPTPVPYNVLEDLANVPAHMTLLYALRTHAQFENLSHVLQEPLIQVDIDGHPPFSTGSKQFSGNFGNLLFLVGFNFRGHFEGLNEGFSRLRFSKIAKGMIEPPK